MKALYGILLTMAALLLSGCSSTAYEIDKQATLAAPWKVGEIIATTADESNAGGGAVGQNICFVNGDDVACDFEREFLGVSKEGYYLVQDFYTPYTVQQHLKGSQDKKVKRTNPYLLSDKTVAESSLFYPSALVDINGRITVWHLTGHKHLEGEVKNALRQGLWIGWYENGVLEGQANFADDEKDGPSTRWYDNGQMNLRSSYSKGYLSGQQEAWYPNGQLSSSEHYVESKPDGLSEIWNPDGQIVARSFYAMGKRHGKQEEWFANGRLYVLANYIDGKSDGADQWWWYGDGKLNGEGKQVSEAEAGQIFKNYNEEKRRLKEVK